MSVASEIARIRTAIAAAYSACEAKGATMPAAANRNVANLASTIASIPYSPPTNPYVTDGLIAWWDGIWNAGLGVHDDDATTWKDLVGELDFSLTSGNYSWGQDSLLMLNGGQAGRASTYIPYATIRTVEAVVESHGTATNSNLFDLSEPLSGLSYQFRSRCWYRRTALNTLNMSGRGNTGGLVNKALPCNSSEKMFASAIYADTAVSSAYKNGELVTSTNSTQGNASSNMYASLGGTNCAGTIWTIRVYNRELTAAEIAANYAVDRERFGV